MKTTTAMIPYHRIFKIIYKEKIIFKRWNNIKNHILSIFSAIFIYYW
jgi:hypothetical protein